MKKLLQTLFFFLSVTQICFAQWVQLGLTDRSIKDVAVGDFAFYAITTDSGSVYRSINGGVNWIQIVHSGAREIEVAPTGTVFMLKDTLFRSSDNGITWFPNVVPQLRLALVRIVVGCGGTIFCGFGTWHPGGSETGIMVSTDDGISWNLADSVVGGVIFGFRDQNIISYGEKGSWGGSSGGVFRSTNCGQAWDFLGDSFKICSLSLCSNGNVLAGGTEEYYGIYLSVDSCVSWAQVSVIVAEDMLSLQSGGTLLGTTGLGIVLFSDNGDSLGVFNEGLTNLNVYTISMGDDGYVYVGSDNGVLRRPLSEMITDVEDTEQLPMEFLLSQNYPNPFNPSTKIKYSVPQSSYVVIKVFDILGNEIETLVNEEKPIGSYTIEFNANALSSGVYFYQLKTGTFVQTRKMLLLK